MRLFLNGGGSAEQSRKLDSTFAGSLPRKKFLYLPQAAAPNPWSFSQAYQWIRDHKAFDDVEIVMWESIAHRSYSELESFDAIYLMGGNTFTLLHQIRESKFDNLLLRFLESGRVVYGISAGVIILGENVESASVGAEADSNDVGISDMSGLGWVSTYNFLTHYDETDESARRYLAAAVFPVVALSETTGLIVDGSKARVVGETPAYVFGCGSRKTFSPGSEFQMGGIC